MSGGTAGGISVDGAPQIHYNNIHGNLRGAVPSDFGWLHEPAKEGYPDWVANVSIANNWWGTTDLDAIEATFLDHKMDNSLGRVYAPTPLAEPVSLNGWQ